MQELQISGTITLQPHYRFHNPYEISPTKSDLINTKSLDLDVDTIADRIMRRVRDSIKTPQNPSTPLPQSVELKIPQTTTAQSQTTYTKYTMQTPPNTELQINRSGQQGTHSSLHQKAEHQVMKQMSVPDLFQETFSRKEAPKVTDFQYLEANRQWTDNSIVSRNPTQLGTKKESLQSKKQAKNVLVPNIVVSTENPPSKISSNSIMLAAKSVSNVSRTRQNILVSDGKLSTQVRSTVHSSSKRSLKSNLENQQQRRKMSMKQLNDTISSKLSTPNPIVFHQNQCKLPRSTSPQDISTKKRINTKAQPQIDRPQQSQLLELFESLNNYLKTNSSPLNVLRQSPAQLETIITNHTADNQSKQPSTQAPPHRTKAKPQTTKLEGKQTPLATSPLPSSQSPPQNPYRNKLALKPRQQSKILTANDFAKKLLQQLREAKAIKDQLETQLKR